MRKLLLFTLAALTFARPVLAGSPHPVTELFPVEPGINAERGFAVAVDGDWLAMGAPRDGDSLETPDTGAVYLFHWSGTTWDPMKKLLADPLQPRAQFGFALAMHAGALAVGAPGEGAVYLFAEDDGAWGHEAKLTVPGHGAGTFGRSLALDDEHLAVGVVDGHGDVDGAVYLYGTSPLTLKQIIHPRPRQKGERFGAALSLAGSVLAVGAPGYDIGAGSSAAGAVYVFRDEAGRWRPKAKLLPPDGSSRAGWQLGFAVATDGSQIFAGAPTADPGHAGAVYRFTQSGGIWSSGEPLPVADPVSGAQLGSSLALSADLLVAGAPAPPPGTGTGKVHVFRQDGATWEEARLVPGNAEIRDLAGFAAAVSGERVVVGGVLGDQGDGAAGAVWSFRCPGGDACTEEAEAVARDTATGAIFGASVALTESHLAVGAPVVGEEEGAGAVYLYRPAGTGWRQEARLTSLDTGFGVSVSLDGRRLAVGAPYGEDFPNGAVYLFSNQEGSWAVEHGFRPENPSPEEAFGASVVLAGHVLAIGAPRGSDAGATYVWEETGDAGAEGWMVTGALTLGHTANGFGSSLALRDGVLAIGAPGEIGATGAVYVAVRGPARWTPSKTLLGLAGLDDVPRFGSSVAVGGGVLAAGTPGLGFIDIVQDAGEGRRQHLTPGDQAIPGFGASLSLLDTRLAVGAPDPQGGAGRAFLFELVSGDWRELLPLASLQGDGFGSAVALSSRFVVVTSPGRSGRVTVFPFPHPEVEPQ